MIDASDLTIDGLEYVQALFYKTLLTQDEMAYILDMPTWQLSLVLDAIIPDELRRERKRLVSSRLQKYSKRVPVPHWYVTNPKRKQVLLAEVTYCERHGLTSLPDNLVIAYVDGNPCNTSITNMMLVTPLLAEQMNSLQRRIRMAKLYDDALNGILVADCWHGSLLESNYLPPRPELG